MQTNSGPPRSLIASFRDSSSTIPQWLKSRVTPWLDLYLVNRNINTCQNSKSKQPTFQLPFPSFPFICFHIAIAKNSPLIKPSNPLFLTQSHNPVLSPFVQLTFLQSMHNHSLAEYPISLVHSLSITLAWQTPDPVSTFSEHKLK